RPGEEGLLVAVLHLVQVAVHRATDDLFVERSIHVKDPGNEAGHAGVSRVQPADAGADAVVGTAPPAEPTCRAERAAAADRPFVLAAPATPGSARAQPAGAERGPGVRGDQIPDDVLDIGAQRRPVGE